jgi:hypothetical protein
MITKRPSDFGPNELLDGAMDEPFVREWDRNRVCIAAAIASRKFQQWVPQRWLELFMDAYEADEAAPQSTPEVP